MRQAEAAIGWIARTLISVATAAGILLTAFVALSAFMRYLVGTPFAFTEETVGLLFSAMVFLSLPYCTYAGTHIRVTLVTDHLSAGWQRRMALASTVFTIAFSLVYGWFAFDFAWTSLALNAKSDIGRIPLWPWMMAMPFACAIMGLAAILRQWFPLPAAAGGGSGV
ncbi:MAG: TRAP transporter small permease subunit [Rhodospirillales bacterium]|nr:TRAP transporter small permease subunit [Rhodospirillales bacterium]